jgi:pyruvate/2-oxoglutarate dehydrogenase complex dihydrolipoamide dehydrogenase (E3) component
MPRWSASSTAPRIRHHGREWSADYAQAVQRSRRVADRMAKGVEFLFRKNKITLYAGWAS